MALGSHEQGEQGGGAGLKIPQGSGAQSPKLSPHVTALSLPWPCVGWVLNEGEAEVSNLLGRRNNSPEPLGKEIPEEHSTVFVGFGDGRGTFHSFCWF